jgi:hypothetical protein
MPILRRYPWYVPYFRVPYFRALLVADHPVVAGSMIKVAATTFPT